MHPQVDNIWLKSVPSIHSERVGLIQETISEIDKYGYKTSLDQYELYLVLDEAISNAMEHGNRWESSKIVELRLLQDKNNEFVVSVLDEGEGFNPDEVKSPSEERKLSLRGRGILIMKTFCRVRWNNKGNNIFLHLPLKK